MVGQKGLAASAANICEIREQSIQCSRRSNCARLTARSHRRSDNLQPGHLSSEQGPGPGDGFRNLIRCASKAPSTQTCPFCLLLRRSAACPTLHAPALAPRARPLWQLSLPGPLACLFCSLLFLHRFGSRSRSRSTFFAHQMFPCAAFDSRHFHPPRPPMRQHALWAPLRSLSAPAHDRYDPSPATTHRTII